MSDPIALAFVEKHPDAAAQVLMRLDPSLIAGFLAHLPSAAAASLLERLTPQLARGCLEHMSTEAGAGLLARIPVQAAATVLRGVKGSLQQTLLQALPARVAMVVRLIVRYPEGMVGALIDPNVSTIPVGFSVGQAIKLLRRAREGVPSRLYVLDETGRLKGMMVPGALLVAERGRRIRDLLQPVPVVLHARAGVNTVRHLALWSRFDALPVVNYAGRFQGVLQRSAVQDKELEAQIATGEDTGPTEEALADLFWMVWGAPLATKGMETATGVRKD
jgi:Mg/Co/Ni transporter MgtE